VKQIDLVIFGLLCIVILWNLKLKKVKLGYIIVRSKA